MRGIMVSHSFSCQCLMADKRTVMTLIALTDTLSALTVLPRFCGARQAVGVGSDGLLSLLAARVYDRWRRLCWTI
jgi:hypothetical protein